MPGAATLSSVCSKFVYTNGRFGQCDGRRTPSRPSQAGNPGAAMSEQGVADQAAAEAYVEYVRPLAVQFFAPFFKRRHGF